MIYINVNFFILFINKYFGYSLNIFEIIYISKKGLKENRQNSRVKSDSKF